VGINVLVETKNGRSFRGRVVEADAYMNVVLDNRNRIALTPTSTKIRDKRIRRDGIFGVEHRDDGIENIDIDGRENENGDIDAGEAGGGDEGDDGGYDWVHVRGSTIRYIVFGANVDVSGVIKAGRDRERSAGDKYRRGVRKGPG
jgi:small nuclear ribonucleoprotein (snRNP)-like protein